MQGEAINSDLLSVCFKYTLQQIKSDSSNELQISTLGLK